MKQAIFLEAADMTLLRNGQPLVIRVGDNMIELMFKARKYELNGGEPEEWTCPQCNKVMAPASKGGHMKWHKHADSTWTCPTCNFKCRPQGRGPHMKMHMREKKK